MKMFDLFVSTMKPTPEDRILDIGVTSDTLFRESNFFEEFYPHKDRIVCVGTEDGSHLEKRHPGLRFVRVQPGEGLPFSDREFDIVFSNAVVEHAGNLKNQTAFVEEARRVGKRVFITTPNRWFPVEHHTALPLLHYLPKGVYRRILSRSSLEYWSHEENLNLLTEGEFVALFPREYPVIVKRVGFGFGPFKSNLAAYTDFTKGQS
jgi:SAM-dependent methyltransferase